MKAEKRCFVSNGVKTPAFMADGQGHPRGPSVVCRALCCAVDCALVLTKFYIRSRCF